MMIVVGSVDDRIFESQLINAQYIKNNFINLFIYINYLHNIKNICPQGSDNSMTYIKMWMNRVCSC